MNSHQKKVLKFRVSFEAGRMTRKNVAARINEMKEEDWKEHLKKRKPDGTCRAGCPLHPRKKSQG